MPVLSRTLLFALVLAGMPTSSSFAGDTDPAVQPLPMPTPRAVFLRALSRIEAAQVHRLQDVLAVAITECLSEELELFAEEQRTPTQRSEGRRTILIGICALFDASGVLEENPFTRPFFRDIVESEEEAARRRLVGGWVHFHHRNDSVRHFFISAALADLAGPVIAERVGRYKEIADAKRLEKNGSGEGFSFLDLAYNHAGIRFAGSFKYSASTGSSGPGPSGAAPIEPLVPVSAFLPDFPELGLPTDLSWTTFREHYYGAKYNEFQKVIARVHASIDESIELENTELENTESENSERQDTTPESATGSGSPDVLAPPPKTADAEVDSPTDE